MQKNKKAFTLVELLVAMAIIGVLVGLAIYGLSTAQRAQRDTERKTALQDLNIGMQSYYETYNSYPTSVTFASASVTIGTAPKTVTVPLKGNALTASGCQGSSATLTQSVNGFASGDNPNTTCYCFDNQVSVGATSAGGYAFCAKMENGSMNCVGSGANVGNTVDCSGASNGYLIP